MDSDLLELVERAASAPAQSEIEIEIERIMGRARRLRRRSVVRGIAGVALFAVLSATAYLGLAHTGDSSSVRIDPANSTLRLPARGTASAQLLRDGTPVWVVRHHDNTVSVLSALSTHTPFGISQLVGWCPSSRGFEDGMYGSQWDERGHKRGGPAPSDLAYANARVLAGGRIDAGPLIATHVRTPPEPMPGAVCFGNRIDDGYNPGTTRRHHFAAKQAVSFGEVRGQTSRRASGHPLKRVVFVRDAVVVVDPTGPARLCPATGPGAAATCRNGIPVADFDTALMRQDDPNRTAVIHGDVLLRPERGALRELAYVDGYSITRSAAPQ